MQEVGDHIWRHETSLPGPSVLIFGGMHGNETVGIDVVTHLRDTAAAHMISGTLTVALGNPRAIGANERWIEGRDLNRYFTDANLTNKSEGSWEESRALVLAELCANADILIDLHSTNKPSIPFACSKVDDAHSRIYRWFDLRAVIEDPEYVFGGGPVSSEEYMDRIGKTGVCIETGYAEDTGRLETTIASCEAALVDCGLYQGTLPSLPPQSSTYRFYTAISYAPGFRFADGKGTHSFQPIAAGEPIGYVGDAAVTVDRGGVIVFPKLPEHWKLGEPVCLIAVTI